MKKRSSAVLALILAILMLLPSVPFAGAQTDGTDTQTNSSIEADDLEVSGDNDVGDLLAGDLSQNADPTADNGSHINSVVISGSEAVVEFYAVGDCEIVIGVYNDDGSQLQCSGRAFVRETDSETSVDLGDELPEYYLVKGFMLDPSTHIPNGKTFVDYEHTEMFVEAFANKTVDDFSAERVINLDEDETNNFVVLSEGTVTASAADGVNVLLEDADGTITIGAPDDAVRGLSVGDIFCYTYGDGPDDRAVIKVGSVTLSDDSVTLTEAQTDADEVFEYVKIDKTLGEDGFYFRGADEFEDTDDTENTENAQNRRLTPKKLKVPANTRYEKEILGEYTSDSKTVNLTDNLSVTFKATAKARYYKYGSYKSVCLLVGISGSLDGEIKVKSSEEIFLGGITLYCVGVASIGLKAYFVYGAEMIIRVSAPFSAAIGFNYSSTEGFSDISQPLRLDFQIQETFKLYVGMKFRPEADLLFGLATIWMEVTFKIELTAKLYAGTVQISNKHSCTACLDGDIDGVIEIKIGISAFWDGFEKNHTFKPKKKRFADFYFSQTHLQGGWGVCPWDAGAQPVSGGEGAQAYTPTYSVKWKNDDGRVLQRDTLEYLDLPIYFGATPTKEADKVYYYTFAGWTPAIRPVTYDITYTAVYDKHYVPYTVTWKNFDGTVLEVDEDMHYGSMPKYNGSTPQRPQEGAYVFKFEGWSPSVSKVTGDAEYTAVYSYKVKLGSYPQTDVTNDLGGVLSYYTVLRWQSFGYYSGDGTYGSMEQGDWMLYTADVTYRGNKYRGVRIDEYRPDETYGERDRLYQYENGYESGKTYWFRYDPIYWNVLDTSPLTVLSRDILDSQAYNDTIYEIAGELFGDADGRYPANDYENSTIRAWLNDDFWNTAFTAEEKAALLPDAYGDCVRLPSYDDMLNSDYGFGTTEYDDRNRSAVGTAYAKAQGLYVYSGTGNSCWRLSTPAEESYFARAVYNTGAMNFYWDVCNTHHGVRPMLTLDTSLSVIGQPPEDASNSPVSSRSLSVSSASATRALSSAPLRADAEDEDTHTAVCNRCIAGNDYVFVAVRDPEADDLLAPSNLVYIDQKTADGGFVGFTYSTDEELSELIFGVFADESAHIFGEWTSAGDGTHIRVCEDCDLVETESCEYSEPQVGVPSTCCTAGTATAVCSVCGGSATEQLELDPENHSGGTELRNRKDPTCGAEGYSGDTFCSGCGALLSSGTSIGPTGEHTWILSGTVVEATCSAKGTALYVCDECGVTELFELPEDPENHCGETVTENTKAPTCGVEGYSGDTFCAGCGALLSSGDPVEATGNHSWGPAKVVKEATCSSTGTAEYTCVECGTTMTEDIPQDPENHSGGMSVIGYSPATESHNGWSGDTVCNGCGEIVVEGRILRFGDPFDQGTGSDLPEDGTCLYCGERHEGFLGAIVKFFHSILYIIKTIFKG